MAWNLRVSAALHQGDRKYMEDQYAIHYECDKQTGRFLYAYFGIFDGHGGADAAKFAKSHLHKNITSNILFFSKDPNDVIKAIEDGFLKTHEDMWKEIGEWPPTATGLPSTAGTTASVAFIKDNKLYTGHVGDSGISLGTQSEGLGKGKWTADHLTVDHKPDSAAEKSRIERMGGKVIPKAGVPRVVWHRPREKGPIRRPNQVDSIPFLAVARSLGDLWSYSFDNQKYAISPQPDVQVLPLDPHEHKCLILATDGLWNLLDAKGAVTTVEMTDRKWFREAIYEKGNGIVGHPKSGDPYYHHASSLVNIVLRRWRTRRLRADNTSAIVVMIDPPGVSVPDTLEKVAVMATQARNRGQKFCARTYLKDNERGINNAERYVLGMAGTYNIQYYDDRDRFELHFGKPAVRYAVSADCSKTSCKADSSIAMYDVIIHKVMTPSKSASNLPSLTSPKDTLSSLRKSTSSKDLKRFRPKSGAMKFGSWLDEDTEGDSLPETEEFDPGNPDNLPVYIDGEKNPVTKPVDALNTEDQLSCSPPDCSEEVSISCTGEQVAVPITNRISPDTTSDSTLLSPPEVPSPQSDEGDHPLAGGVSRPHPIMKRLKGVAKSLVSLHDSKKAAERSNGRSMILRRKAKKPTVVVGSPAKKKRHSTAIDMFNSKKQKVVPPQVQLTKMATLSTPDLRIGLRPRQTK